MFCQQGQNKAVASCTPNVLVLLFYGQEFRWSAAAIRYSLSSQLDEKKH